ncbi:MAG: DUF1015 family protein [Oscillospiraceae bacterium]|nr:DUF1015 family protein [Oscillospiraceae bacterium]
MAVFRPFQAIRPLPEFAAEVAALPYDVMNSEEARKMAEGNPHSFLRVDKAEIDLPPGTDLYSEAVYQKARKNLEKLVRDNVCKKDAKPCVYIYTQTTDGRSQTGLVGCASIDDYMNNVIKKHELTRADKEADRVRHVDVCDANTGPIFLCYREQEEISGMVAEWKSGHAPVYDFVSDGNVGNAVWVIDCGETIVRLERAFAQAGSLYIADGHHRAASAVKVGQKRRAANPGFTGDEEFNFFLAVLFPQNELAIMDYNRVIRDLNGLTADAFLSQVSEKFEVTAVSGLGDPYRPTEKNTFGMLLDGKWYRLAAKPGSFDEKDPVARLDVSILQNNLIAPVLGINDPRTDKRIDFVGGIRGLRELEKRASDDMRLAFSMYPTTLDDLFDIADAGEIMPPKSTWFEPKLLSGLFIHLLS